MSSAELYEKLTIQLKSTQSSGKNKEEKMVNILKRAVKKIVNNDRPKLSRSEKIQRYFQNGSIPWTEGYAEFKWDTIVNSINDSEGLKAFVDSTGLRDYAKGIDERAVEYPWIYSKLSDKDGSFLDAGSTFNFGDLLDHKKVSSKKKTILTYFPESNCFFDRRISYVYDDLRDIPLKDELFDEIVCQSTIEHIDMDNSIYGYGKSEEVFTTKSYEYLKAVQELLRILKPGGVLLLTFPFGAFENHGFFQQFDTEMLAKLVDLFELKGSYTTEFFKYEVSGWCTSTEEECSDSKSFNPHTGIGKGVDNAAHSRAICCVQFTKKSN